MLSDHPRSRGDSPDYGQCRAPQDPSLCVYHRHPEVVKNGVCSSNRSPWKRRPPLCHPERSRGICSSADLFGECFSTECVMGLWPISAKLGRITSGLPVIRRLTPWRIPDWGIKGQHTSLGHTGGLAASQGFSANTSRARATARSNA